MRITDYLKRGGALILPQTKDKNEVIDKMIAFLEDRGCVSDASIFKKDILRRESFGTTAIGMEIAIPHAKSNGVNALSVVAAVTPSGVDCGSPDGMPCKLFFMIAATEDSKKSIDILAQLMMLLMHIDVDNPTALKSSTTEASFISAFDALEGSLKPNWRSEPLESPGFVPRQASRAQRTMYEPKPKYRNENNSHYNAYAFDPHEQEPFPAVRRAVQAPDPPAPARPSVSVNVSGMSDLLCDVKQELGIETFAYPKRVKGILFDKAPEMKREIKLISVALDSGLYNEAYLHIGDEGYYTQLQKNRYVLSNEFFLSDTYTEVITEWYCKLLNIKTH